MRTPSQQALPLCFLPLQTHVVSPCFPFDRVRFTQGGFRAVGITGLSHKLEDYYHTRRDSYDNLNEAGMENCYLATVRFIEKIEEQ